MEYTDLELNKMIAELEGENHFITYIGYPFNKEMLCINDGVIPSNDDPEGYDIYDCVNDWGLIGPLMVKYKVEIDYDFNNCKIWGDNKRAIDFESESEIPRAIIMCILKSENII